MDSGYPPLLPSDRETTGTSEMQHYAPTIRQPQLGGFHPLAQLYQITGEPTIIERT